MPLTKDLRWSNIDLVFRESHICSLVVTYLERHFSSGLMKTWSVLVFLIYALEFFFFRNKPWFLFHQKILRNFVFDLFNTYSKWLNEEKKILFSILTPVDTGNFYINIKFIFFVNMGYICTIRWSFIGLRKYC